MIWLYTKYEHRYWGILLEAASTLLSQGAHSLCRQCRCILTNIFLTEAETGESAEGGLAEGNATLLADFTVICIIHLIHNHNSMFPFFPFLRWWSSISRSTEGRMEDISFSSESGDKYRERNYLWSLFQHFIFRSGLWRGDKHLSWRLAVIFWLSYYLLN